MNTLPQTNTTEPATGAARISRITQFDGRFPNAASEGSAFHSAYKEPEGLWRPLAANSLTPPKLPAAALYGVVGVIIRKLEPYSEANPASLCMQLLAALGSALGGGAYFEVENDRHSANLFLALVGKSSKARKGVSWGRVEAIMSQVDYEWLKTRVLSGLSSGEGLVHAVRDDSQGKNNEIVEGVRDKRLLVFEGEFAQVLRVMRRDGNTLSGILRNAWDGRPWGTMTKQNPLKATGAHVSVVAHITNEELQREIRDTAEMFNGFANRFLWCYAARCKFIPHNVPLPVGYLNEEMHSLREALVFGRKLGPMRRDEAAEALWAKAYERLGSDPGGLLGGATNRGEAQVVRLSVLFAVLDCSPVIREAHLQAALAVWEYCGESARYAFGERLGDPLLDKLAAGLKASGVQGLSRTQIHGDIFQRNQSGERIAAALVRLEEMGLARKIPREGESRESVAWVASSPFAMNEFYEQGEAGAGGADGNS